MKKGSDNPKNFILIAFWVLCTHISHVPRCRRKGKKCNALSNLSGKLKQALKTELYRLGLTCLGGILQFFSDLLFKTKWKERRTVSQQVWPGTQLWEECSAPCQGMNFSMNWEMKGLFGMEILLTWACVCWAPRAEHLAVWRNLCSPNKHLTGGACLSPVKCHIVMNELMLTEWSISQINTNEEHAEAGFHLLPSPRWEALAVQLQIKLLPWLLLCGETRTSQSNAMKWGRVLLRCGNRSASGSRNVEQDVCLSQTSSEGVCFLLCQFHGCINKVLLICFISKACQVVLVGRQKRQRDVFLSITANLDSLRCQEIFGLALGFKTLKLSKKL